MKIGFFTNLFSVNLDDMGENYKNKRIRLRKYGAKYGK